MSVQAGTGSPDFIANWTACEKKSFGSSLSPDIFLQKESSDDRILAGEEFVN
jgi:hypothetical protein